MRHLRMENLPPLGEFVTITEPGGEEKKWVVVSYEEDPNALWEFEHFTPAEGGSEIRPRSFLVSLKALP